MIHLLMGYPCDTLGVYPFTPHQIQRIESTLGEILGENMTEPFRTAQLCMERVVHGTDVPDKGLDSSGYFHFCRGGYRFGYPFLRTGGIRKGKYAD